MKSSEIRKKFFEFFIQRGHEKVASSSLIPAQDPTLLFANAGMNQFKDLFLGKEQRSYNRAVTIQKCVRAGGKHNDLDNVGFTKRHLTFFEMMGNFSFGDYFKEDAIKFAWDFLTKEMNFPVEKMHASVFYNDEEAYAIWRDIIKLPEERIHRLGEEENFWRMGDSGPCGPCTELHIERGPEHGCADIKLCGPACNCDRFLEVWNLVFMQFDQMADGTMKKLERTGVDTGMGFERLAIITQNVDSVFSTDFFQNIIKKTEELTGVSYADKDHETQAAFHVLADHIRSSSLLIADSCAPSNEGRGYVLRKIIRRAALFAQKLTDKNIFPELAKVVIADMGDIYPELKTNEKLIISLLKSEIEKFATNLVRGQNLLEKYVEEHKGSNVVSGEQAFKLYDTFGFPMELIILVANKHGFTVDQAGFEHEMLKQQEKSGKKLAGTQALPTIELPQEIKTEFKCYQELETASEIIALIVDNQLVKNVPAGTQCTVITKASPFFIEGGGQVADQGWISVGKEKTEILAATKQNGAILVTLVAPVALSIGTQVVQTVNKELRTNAMKNHTATHLLQAALISLFGKHIKQSGSLVAPDYLRFDFTYHENLSTDDISQVEALVNQKIMENIATNIEFTTYKDAVSRDIIAFFGEKYNPEDVRVVHIPGFSAELCGGTHVHRTGDIGCFKIVEVTALSAGHRRIVAVTGPKAVELYQESFNAIKALGQEFKVQKEDVTAAVFKQKEQLKEAQTQIKQLKKQLVRAQLPVWEKAVETVGTLPFLALALEGLAADELKEVAQSLNSKKPGVYFIYSADKERATFVMLIDAHLAQRVPTKTVADWLHQNHGLRGGGKDTFIQGGGQTCDARVVDALKAWLSTK